MIALLLITSCTNKPLSKKESDFIKISGVSRLNTDMKLMDNTIFSNKFLMGFPVKLQVQNISRDTISFVSGKSIKLYFYDDNLEQWSEIKDREKDLEPNNLVLIAPTGSGLPSSVPMTFLPDLGDHKTPTVIRVLFIGNIYKDNSPTDEKVGAYLDLQMNP